MEQDFQLHPGVSLGGVATAVSPKLIPLPGQIVESDSRGRTLVEVRRSHGADPWRTLMDHSEHTTPFSMSRTPYTAWLPPGVFDLRVSGDGFTDMVLEEVEIRAAAEPYVIPAASGKGRSIAGAIRTNARPGHDHDLFLFRLEPSGWVEQKCKRTDSFRLPPDYGTDRFSFQHLSPGRYRVSLDTQGEILLGQWNLQDKDIVAQLVTHTLR